MAAAVATAAASFGIATGAYVDERDDWHSAVARARREGWRWLELTAIRGRLEPLLAYLADHPDTLDGFERVSIHAPAKTEEPLANVLASLEPLGLDVVLHPDVYLTQREVARLAGRAVFENMDVAKRFGRDVADLATVFDSFPQAGFCLDVAHVRTNDPTLTLGHELLDAFGERLRQLHVSGIEPDGTHRPTTAADLALYRPLLDRVRHVPWLLEAELAGGAT